MPAKHSNTLINRAVTTTTLFFSFSFLSAQADPRLAVGPLPETLINTGQCLNVGDNGWGWDGEQSCHVSNVRLAGAQYPLTRTRSDFSGSDLAWAAGDLAGRTVRCDNYQRSFLPNATDNEYTRARYDITFLTDDSIPASATQENLSEVTAHLYTRGWRIGQFGRLDTGLQTQFGGNGFATESGYLFVEDLGRQNSDGEYIVSEFSHCFLRDENTPLRATGYCVDYDGDGIGWNGTRECEVNPVNPNCDYSASGFNFGWGFNTATGESCPPVDNTALYTAENRCVGNGPDGWGWNQALQESCRIDE